MECTSGEGRRGGGVEVTRPYCVVTGCAVVCAAAAAAAVRYDSSPGFSSSQQARETQKKKRKTRKKNNTELFFNLTLEQFTISANSV